MTDVANETKGEREGVLQEGQYPDPSPMAHTIANTEAYRHTMALIDALNEGWQITGQRLDLLLEDHRRLKTQLRFLREDVNKLLTQQLHPSDVAEIAKRGLV